jgi:methyltransferase (TIGR00027 family)
MQEREPSRTALAVATHRAAHQVVEGGRVFADPLALRIIGADARTLARDVEANPSRRGMRFFVSARSAVAEAALEAAVETRGVGQLVLLGAGLDTFAYRNPFEGRLRVFEVDHPATQAWKRRRLSDAGIAAPASMAYAPVDFERDRLLDRLLEAGFDPARRTFFTWLGVVSYLTEAAVMATLEAIGVLPRGGEVVFDYSDPPATMTAEAQVARARRAAAVAAAGEPFRSSFEPAALHAALRRLGFGNIEDLGPGELAKRFGGNDRRGQRGGHVLWAATPI